MSHSHACIQPSVKNVTIDPCLAGNNGTFPGRRTMSTGSEKRNGVGVSHKTQSLCNRVPFLGVGLNVEQFNKLRLRDSAHQSQLLLSLQCILI